MTANVEDSWRLEAPVAVAEQHRDAAEPRARIGDREVDDAVAIEVARHDEGQTSARSKALRCGEGAITVAQQYLDAVNVIGHRQVWYPVPIEVSHRHGYRVTAAGEVSPRHERKALSLGCLGTEHT